MELQLAVDRVTVEVAAKLIEETIEYIDIIEVGTSLIKDFGLKNSVGSLKRKFPEKRILADIKTCDEGEYEFRKSYEAGADIATVMGMSSMETIRVCKKVANEFGKGYMIDLLEVTDEKLSLLQQEFQDGIFCIHLPSDKDGEGLLELIKNSKERLADEIKIAVAGGVKLTSISVLKEAGVEIAIIGSGITKAKIQKEAARSFHDAIKN